MITITIKNDEGQEIELKYATEAAAGFALKYLGDYICHWGFRKAVGAIRMLVHEISASF